MLLPGGPPARAETSSRETQGKRSMYKDLQQSKMLYGSKWQMDSSNFCGSRTLIWWASPEPSVPCTLCTVFHPVRKGSATTNWRCITGSTAHPLPIFSSFSREHRANHSRLKATTVALGNCSGLGSQRHICTRHIYTRSSVIAWNDDSKGPQRQRHSLNVILTPSLNHESVSLFWEVSRLHLGCRCECVSSTREKCRWTSVSIVRTSGDHMTFREARTQNLQPLHQTSVPFPESGFKFWGRMPSVSETASLPVAWL